LRGESEKSICRSQMIDPRTRQSGRMSEQWKLHLLVSCVGLVDGLVATSRLLRSDC
jgi:hypothetical protein